MQAIGLVSHMLVCVCCIFYVYLSILSQKKNAIHQNVFLVFKFVT